MAEKGNISVKDVDMEVFLEIRSIAAKNRMKMGDIVTQALKMWLEDYRVNEQMADIVNQELKMRPEEDRENELKQ